MEIVETKRLKDGLNFVIEYMEDGQLHCLFISAEKVVKNYKAVEQSVQADGLTICENCGSWLRAGECENCNSPIAPARR